MKRISVIVSSIIIFRNPVQPVNALGAAIAIAGTFLYSQVRFYMFFFLKVIFSYAFQYLPGMQISMTSMIYLFDKISRPITL